MFLTSVLVRAVPVLVVLEAGAAKADALEAGVFAPDVLEASAAEPDVLDGEVVKPNVLDVGAEPCLGLVLSALGLVLVPGVLLLGLESLVFFVPSSYVVGVWSWS